jgi:hypothetical protein
MSILKMMSLEGLCHALKNLENFQFSKLAPPLPTPGLPPKEPKIIQATNNYCNCENNLLHSPWARPKEENLFQNRSLIKIVWV